MKKPLKIFIRSMIIIISLVVILAIMVGVYMQQAKFGAKPEGKRLERMQVSPNYKNGSFINRTYTPSLTEGYSMS